MEPKAARPERRRLPRIVLGIGAAYNVAIGLILLLSLGLRGFAGTAGEDSLHFALVGYVSVAMLALGALAALASIRRSRRLAAGPGAGFIIVALFLVLFALFPFGLLNLGLGVSALIVRKGF